MQIVINTSTIDVSLSDDERSKLEGGDVTKTLAKYIRRALATFSLHTHGIKAPENGVFITDESNNHQMCFARGRHTSNHTNLVSLDDITGTSVVGNVVTFRNTNDIELIVECKDSSYRLENIKYTMHDKDNDIEINATFGDEYMKHISEEFMNMILALDIDASIIGANTVVSSVIKMESIATGVSHESKMFHNFAPTVVTYNATPVFVNYTNRGFYLRDPKFAVVGSYRIYVNNTNVGVGYCYAPGYVRMELDFVTCTPIRASNIVELEQCLAITAAVNEKVVANGPTAIEVTDQVNWYAKNSFYESKRTNDIICSKIAKAIVHTELQVSDFIGGAPGYDRLYNIFSEIKRFKESSGELEISDKEVIKLLCDGLGINLEKPGSFSADVHQKERKLSMICDALKTLNLRALPDGDVAEVYYHVLEQILPLEERGMEMVDVLTGLLHVMVDTGICSPSVIQYAVEEFDELIAANSHRRDSRRDRDADRRDRRSSSRVRFESRFRDGLRTQGLRNAFEEAMENAHFDKSASDRLYRNLFADIETLVIEHEGTLRISDVGHIIAYTLNKYSGSNPYVVQCGNKTLDCIIGDLVKLNSDKLSVGDMLEFINPAGVREVISKIDTYVDELRAYIVEGGKVHL